MTLIKSFVPHSRCFGSYFDVIFLMYLVSSGFSFKPTSSSSSSSSTQFCQEWVRRKVVVKHSIKSKSKLLEHLIFKIFLGEAPQTPPTERGHWTPLRTFPWDAFGISSGASRHILSLTKFLGTPPQKSCIRPCAYCNIRCKPLPSNPGCNTTLSPTPTRRPYH